MTKGHLTLVARISLFAVLVVSPAAVFGQIPAGGSSARNIQTEVEKSAPRVAQIIKKAEDSFRKGKLNLEAGKRSEARDDFDQAVDEILTSGIDVRASHELQTYYLELVERIYREEVPTIAPSKQGNVIELVADKGQTQSTPPPVQQVGFVDQTFEPAQGDILARLVLTPEEEKVSDADVAALEQAQHNINFAFKPHPLIQQYINYYQGRGRSTMESGLRRSGVYMKMARQIFKEEGVPVDITWLGQVESAWKPKAMSWAAASGLWQFVPGTGRQFGLRQTAWIDERNSFEQATRASAKYLKSLASHYNGNWELAMAAYNTGAGNVDRGVQRAGGSASFWDIYPYIAQETRNYVPNILATILIAKNPEKYGFKGIKPDAPMAYDVVQVSGSTSLQLVAEATDSSVDYIRGLNPELKRDVTPKGEAYNVRVPGGRGKQFFALLKRIPADRRETARIISIVPGEDLQAVANRTSTSVAQLQALNSGVDLKSTNKLVVPNSNVRLTLNRRKPATAEVAAPTLTRIRARKGDTIAKIAAARNLDANEVARINGVTPGVELQAGQEIRLPATVAAAPTRRR